MDARVWVLIVFDRDDTDAEGVGKLSGWFDTEADARASGAMDAEGRPFRVARVYG